jgi:plasmid stability protein
MPSIQIKNVPPDVHRVLKRRAAEAGMSLQEYLLAELTSQARQPTLEEVLESAGQQTGGRLSMREAVEYIRADRDSR